MNILNTAILYTCMIIANVYSLLCVSGSEKYKGSGECGRSNYRDRGDFSVSSNHHTNRQNTLRPFEHEVTILALVSCHNFALPPRLNPSWPHTTLASISSHPSLQILPQVLYWQYSTSPLELSTSFTSLNAPSLQLEFASD